MNLWMMLSLVLLAALRMPRVRAAVGAVLMMAMTLGSARAQTAADHVGEWYVGGDLGYSWLKPHDVNGDYRADDTTSSGYRLLLGKQLWQDWSLEAFYANPGKAGIASQNANVGHLGTLGYKVFGAGTEWTPLLGGRGATFYPVFKGGLAATSNSASTSTIRYDKLHGVGFYFGAAGVWQFAEHWRAQLELTSYDKDERMLTAGVRYLFGAGKVAAPVPVVAAAPVAAPPAPVVEPEPAPAPLPPPAPPAPPADDDQDGVPNTTDKCPTTPANDKVDAEGCSLTIRLQVYFDNDSGKLKPESTAELERVVAFMQAVPTAAGELQGHTDSVGKDSYNLALSQKRAESVKAWMVDKGIDPSRITAKGYGESQPVASNDTAEGRAENRRVLFVRSDVKN